MSHDENSHVYYSWLFYQGQGYSHDPITHGPMQFHLVALSYFLFGDNDLTARIPAVLFSIATVAFMWAWRRYLGRAGALIAALLMIISPYILYYGRYVRNEAFVAFFGVVTLWAILRFIETGGKSYLLILTAVTSLHFTTKETAFIYTAQAMLFLGFYLIYRLTTRSWINGDDRKRFLILLLVALLLVGTAFGFMLLQPDAPPGAGATAEGVVPAEGEEAAPALQSLPGVLWLFIAAALLVAAAAIFFLVRGYSWERLRSERAFGVLIVLTTLVLPMLAPFPVRALGVNPIDYNSPTSMTYTIAFVVVLSLLGVAVGLLWNWRDWLLNAAVFYVIFTVLYTSLFTNGLGFLTGLVGSLGYWLEQQGVNRGNQPLYYYALVQVPIYEFLPALGSLLALVLAVLGKRAPRVPGAEQPALVAAEADENLPEEDKVSGDEIPAWITADDPPGAQPDVIQPPVLSLLGFWVISSLLAYTVAGEKMPWLTVHITLPMILLSGWSLGWLIEATDWRFVRRRRGALILLLIPLFTLSLAAALGALLGTAAPFQGSTIEELRVTTQFVVSLVVAVLAGLGLFFLLREWEGGQFYRL
ncbi:MAG TPA: glycosyltransferase family 39 protein, partial [Anaerolineales bacterium]|nr:glycosyltransferase family 39 protein [Anaerolineales bacterium]